MTLKNDEVREFERWMHRNGLSYSSIAQYTAALRSVKRAGSLSDAQENASAQVCYRMQRACELWKQFKDAPDAGIKRRTRKKVDGKSEFFTYLTLHAGLSMATASIYQSGVRTALRAGGENTLNSNPDEFLRKVHAHLATRDNVRSIYSGWNHFKTYMRTFHQRDVPDINLSGTKTPQATLDKNDQLAIWVLWDVGYLSPQAIAKLDRETISFSKCRSIVYFPSTKGEQTGRGCVTWAFAHLMRDGNASGPLVSFPAKKIKELCAATPGAVAADPLATAHKVTREWSRRMRQSANPVQGRGSL